jgi:IS5 family transposase
MRQQTFAAQRGFREVRRKTSWDRFLEEMEQIVPWAELQALVEPHYPKGEKGRPGTRPETSLSIMLRVYFLQQSFKLSDPGCRVSLLSALGLLISKRLPCIGTPGIGTPGTSLC